MSRFYSFIWDEIATSKTKIAREFGSGPSIFVPLAYACRQDDAVPGMFLSSEEVYWHDSTGSVDQAKELLQHGSISKTISHVYPGLHDFFVHECGVHENPSFRGYLQILLQLSTIALPSQSANVVSTHIKEIQLASIMVSHLFDVFSCLSGFQNTIEVGR